MLQSVCNNMKYCQNKEVYVEHTKKKKHKLFLKNKLGKIVVYNKHKEAKSTKLN